MLKRGQITIFIVVALLIVASVALYFVLGGSRGFGQGSLDPETQKVYDFTKNCLQENLEEGVYWIGKGGGYYNSASISNLEGVPYYIYDGRSYYPEIEDINKEISSYIDSNIGFCLGKFENFPQFNITKEESSTLTEIRGEEIVSETEYLITIQRADEKTLIKDFETKTPSRLKEMYIFAGEILDNYSDDGLCLSCMYETAEAKDFKIDMTNNEDGLIIAIIDENRRGNYEFKFAIYNE